MDAPDQIIVFIHGIGPHLEGFSNRWFDSLKPHLDCQLERDEVVWSDVVNSSVRSVMSAMMDDMSEMKEMKAAIESVMMDRLMQTEPAEMAEGEVRMPMTQASSLIRSSILDDFVFYMFNSFIREQILSRFENVMKKHLASGKAIHLVAHSWGTVVAYEGMRRLESNSFDGTVRNFFTVGSALSLAPVQSNLFGRISDGKKPSLNNKWFNLDAKWDLIGGRIGNAFDVDSESLGLKPVGCRAFLGLVNPTCAHSSYFDPENKQVNKSIFAKAINA